MHIVMCISQSIVFGPTYPAVSANSCHFKESGAIAMFPLLTVMFLNYQSDRDTPICTNYRSRHGTAIRKQRSDQYSVNRDNMMLMDITKSLFL